jgi:uncharacterized protein (TIGR03437 family)
MASVKVTLSTCTGTDWLSVSPSDTFTASPAETTFTVSVKAAGVPAGTNCSGMVYLSTPNGVWGTQAMLKVTAPVALQVAPLSLTFSAAAGGAAPASQTLQVAAQPGASVTATAAAQTCNGSKWLALSPNGRFTAGSAVTELTVSVDQTGLSAGAICTGTISFVTNSGTQAAGVTLVVTEAASNKQFLTATPASLTFISEAGKPAPAPQIISISAGGTASTFTVSTGGATWLRVSPSCTAASPCTAPTSGTLDLTVTADPTGLNAGVTDAGTISVAGLDPSAGIANVSVMFSRTAPVPKITLVTNAASYLAGPISPGEMIAIFAKAANPIGPATAVFLNETSCPSPCTNLPATMGGVQVFFQPGNVPAPLTYVSSTQVNCLVPYEMLGAKSIELQVSYLGQTSDVATLQYAATQPGIFTALGTGTGLVSAQQYDQQGNYKGQNSSSNPASPGWYISFYATGEGIVETPAVSGKVTSAGTVLPLMGPPSVTIDNLPATVAYFAEANGLVSGVMQVNASIPPAVRTGQAVSLTLAMDGRYSQPGVVVYIR